LDSVDVILSSRSATTLIAPWRACRHPGGSQLDHGSAARTPGTFWSQYTNQPTGRAGSTVAVEAAGTVTDRWSLAAVELENSGD
jgi:hypothetical protein